MSWHSTSEKCEGVAQRGMLYQPHHVLHWDGTPLHLTQMALKRRQLVVHIIYLDIGNSTLYVAMRRHRTHGPGVGRKWGLEGWGQISRHRPEEGRVKVLWSFSCLPPNYT